MIPDRPSPETALAFAFSMLVRAVALAFALTFIVATIPFKKPLLLLLF
jgi:hypothetical protein